MSACVFCRKIADGTVDPTTDDEVVTFIPLNPVTPGHRLFVPRTHVEHAAEQPGITGRVFAEAARWGQGTGNAGAQRGFNLITSAGEVATQSVRHLHIHYVQRRPNDGLHLPWTGQAAAPARDQRAAEPHAGGTDDGNQR